MLFNLVLSRQKNKYLLFRILYSQMKSIWHYLIQLNWIIIKWPTKILFLPMLCKKKIIWQTLKYLLPNILFYFYISSHFPGPLGLTLNKRATPSASSNSRVNFTLLINTTLLPFPPKRWCNHFIYKHSVFI